MLGQHHQIRKKKLSHNAEEDYGLHPHDHQRDRDDPLAAVRAAAEYTRMCCVFPKLPSDKRGLWGWWLRAVGGAKTPWAPNALLLAVCLLNKFIYSIDVMLSEI